MPLWTAPQPLVLASKSDIRGKILAAAGLRFGIRPGQIDERAIEQEAGVTEAKAVAQLLARAKALSASSGHFGHMVLGADQTLALDGKRYDKPETRTEAATQLRQLRGKTHALHSALALVRDGTVLFECVDTAQLTMRDFSDRFLEDYLDMVGDTALASVGAYQLEGIGVHLFKRVEGDYFTILGLPLLPLLKFFRESGFVDG
jgi:septum formation protein